MMTMPSTTNRSVFLVFLPLLPVFLGSSGHAVGVFDCCRRRACQSLSPHAVAASPSRLPVAAAHAVAQPSRLPVAAAQPSCTPLLSPSRGSSQISISVKKMNGELLHEDAPTLTVNSLMTVRDLLDTLLLLNPEEEWQLNLVFGGCKLNKAVTLRNAGVTDGTELNVAYCRTKLAAVLHQVRFRDANTDQVALQTQIQTYNRETGRGRLYTPLHEPFHNYQPSIKQWFRNPKGVTFAFSGDGTKVLTRSSSTALVLWDLFTGAVIARVMIPDHVHEFVLSEDGYTGAAVWAKLYYWSVPRDGVPGDAALGGDAGLGDAGARAIVQPEIVELSVEDTGPLPFGCSNLAISDDGNMVAFIQCSLGSRFVWKPGYEKPEALPELYPALDDFHSVRTITVLPDKSVREVVHFGRNLYIVTSDPETAQILSVKPDKAEEIDPIPLSSASQFSRDGSRLLLVQSVGLNPKICVHDAVTGGLLYHLELEALDHADTTRFSAKFSADGTRLFVQNDRKDQVLIWDVEGDEPVGPRTLQLDTAAEPSRGIYVGGEVLEEDWAVLLG